MFDKTQMGYTIRQLAVRESNLKWSDFSIGVGVSTSGPVALKISHRSNAFSSSISYGGNAIRISGANFLEKARRYAMDFSEAANEL